MSIETETDEDTPALPDNHPDNPNTQTIIVQKTSVFVTHKFHGWHKWIDAPMTRAYLRDYHRHLFGVKVLVRVQHNDRDVEFHDLQDMVIAFVDKTFKDQHFLSSCEDIGQTIARHLIEEKKLEVSCITVDEDGENGAFIGFDYQQVVREQ
jgi:hypothetical protein